MANSSTPSFKGQDVYCGIDVHKSTWAISARCNGVEMFHGTVAASPRVAVQTLQHRFPEARFHCAYEAGFCGFGIHRELAAAGFDSIVVNPADIPTNGKERVFKKGDPLERMRGAVEILSAIPGFDGDSIHAAFEAKASELGIKFTEFFPPLRFAISGTASGPDLMPMLEVLGREKVVERLKKYLANA